MRVIRIPIPQDLVRLDELGMAGEGAYVVEDEDETPGHVSAASGRRTFAGLDCPVVDGGRQVAFAESHVAADFDECDAAGLDEPADHAFVDGEHRGGLLDRQE